MVSNAIGDVAKYLAEAATSIFKTSESNVPWSGTPFTGAQHTLQHTLLQMAADIFGLHFDL